MDANDATDRERPANPGRKTGTLSNVSPGDTLAGRFILREILGYGATGTVFSALDRSVGQKVAIKVLHPDLHDERTRERLRREVRASRNGHPNVVAVYDLHEANDRVFLSLELVEGHSLKELLGERTKLETPEVVAIGRQVAAALAHLHSLGIIHRDVKPGNILLTTDGAVKLCDMGLARPIEEGMTVTETEMVVGTPAYMAPEQGIGADLTTASDTYALGITLYQCLTKKVPLTSETAVATLTRRQRERPPAVRRERPDCPRWLGRLIRRMLEPRPGDRPSAAQIARALEKGKLWPRPRRKTLVAAAAVAAVAVLAMIVGSRFLNPTTVRVDVEGTEIRGYDGANRQTWSYVLPDHPISVERGDLDGDGLDEIVVAGRTASDNEVRSTTASRSFVIAVTEDGHPMTESVLQELIGGWSYPYRLDLNPLVSIEDLDADGWNEIVVNCRHNGFYPAVLLAYWPRWDVWDVLLHHPGSLISVGTARETGRPGLRFVAYNNLLGMTKVYGEIDLAPPGTRPGTYGRKTHLTAPPGPMTRHTSIGSWRTYVPFADGSAAPYRDDRFSIEQTPGLVIGLADRGPTFDAFFNPIAGPNRGLDLRDRRLRFAESLGLLGDQNHIITDTGVASLLESIRADAGPLMHEAPYEIILSTLGAKALAAAGNLDGAIDLLEQTRLRARDDDLLYRLANLQAIRGETAAARATALDAIDNGSTARSWFDVPMLFLELAITEHNAADVATAIDYLVDRGTNQERRTGLRNNLAARARLWWDDGTPIDGQIQPVFLDADGDAVACLVRWRLGATMADDVESMRASIHLNPDSYKLGTIAFGAALIAQGRPDEALSEIDVVISTLAQSARWDFADAQIMSLAKAMRTVALEAAGDTDAARASAQALAPDLDPPLLPGILVREVLDRTNG